MIAPESPTLERLNEAARERFGPEASVHARAVSGRTQYWVTNGKGNQVLASNSLEALATSLGVEPDQALPEMIALVAQVFGAEARLRFTGGLDDPRCYIEKAGKKLLHMANGAAMLAELKRRAQDLAP